MNQNKSLIINKIICKINKNKLFRRKKIKLKINSNNNNYNKIIKISKQLTFKKSNSNK